MFKVMLRSNKYGTIGTVATGRKRHTQTWGMELKTDHYTGRYLHHVDCAHYFRLPKKFEDAPIGYEPKRIKIGSKYHYL